MAHLVWLEQTFQDVRYGLRTLQRNPWFTTVVVLTLALGIGMNTAVFSVVNAVLLRSLAYPRAERLTWLAPHDPEWGDNLMSRTDYTFYRDQARSFESMTAYLNQDLALVARGEASQERIASISGDFWSMTGAQAQFGRLFRPGDTDSMVLSWGLFERRFAADPRVIGSTVRLDGHTFNVTGVLPRSFQFLFPQFWQSGDERRPIDGYITVPGSAMRLQDSSWKQLQAVMERLGPLPFAVCVVARLRPDVSFKAAQAEGDALYMRLVRDHPSPYRGRMLRMIPVQEKVAGGARRALMVLLVAVGFVLLIAAANVANLLLARSIPRQKEIAIRTAIGAKRWRIIRQFLIEGALLALSGGAAGLVLARWSLTVLIHLSAQAIPRLESASIDGTVLVFILAVSLLAGLGFGSAPAIAPWETNLHQTLKAGVRASFRGARRFPFLVTTELALAIVLLTGAGLMLKSFWRMSAKPPGFSPEKALVMRVSLSGPQYNAWPPKQTYLHEVLRRVETARAVEASGIDCGTLHTSIQVEGGTSPRGEEPFASIRFVSPGYLRALGVPLLKGHWPADSDLFSVVVNETFARTWIGRADPVGRHIGGSFLSGTITGVVADFKYWQLDAEPSPEIYYPYERSPVMGSIRVVVRTHGNAIAFAPAIRKLVSSIDRTQPVYEFQTLEQALDDSIAPRRFNLFLLGVFATTALVLALIGIYGVIAYSVSQRTHEIGIRMALGAERRQIVRMVLRQGMMMSVVGIAAGLAAALGLTRLMQGLLYGVEPGDPSTFAAVAIVMALTALLACLAPALKAALVDPNIALRHE